MAKLDRYLVLANQRRASDLHFSAGEPLRFRVDGDLVIIENRPMDAKEVQELFLEIMTDAERQRYLEHKNLDKSYSTSEAGNFRVNVFMTRRGAAAVLRTIPSKIPRPQDLGLPQSIVDLTNLGKGLILVTGPTGSGKSTTLAALINHINETCNYHILTVEDPVEFIHSSRQSLINQREIGNSCLTFADALKYALREDPDVILVGEMRDLETIGLALTAAETGHLVFGTLHTRGAAASVDRIIDSFPANQQAMIRTMLSDSLAAVVSQALLKKADGSGRIAAYEIMIKNSAISNLIREGKTFQMRSVMQTAKKEGMVLMDAFIQDLIQKKIVTPEEGSGYMEEKIATGAFGQGSKTGAASLAAQMTSNTPHPPPKPAIVPKASAPVLPQAAVRPAPIPPPVIPKPTPVLEAPFQTLSKEVVEEEIEIGIPPLTKKSG